MRDLFEAFLFTYTDLPYETYRACFPAVSNCDISLYYDITIVQTLLYFLI